MNVYYLSENIYLKDDILYNKGKIIKKYNWHLNLNELGWEKIPKPLIKILNKNSINKYKNSQYGMLDCGQDGSCFFHCIAYALNTNEIYKDKLNIYNNQSLRNILTESITENKFNEIIDIYKLIDTAIYLRCFFAYPIKYNIFKSSFFSIKKLKIKDDKLYTDRNINIHINNLIGTSKLFKNVRIFSKSQYSITKLS